MPQVIRNTGDPRNTVTIDGGIVHREERIFLSSHHQWYPVLHTSMHFCYKDPIIRSGKSTIWCTCGSFAGIFGYEGYKKYNSFIGVEVVACNHFIQYGVHSDGSHE